jgi:hypothetical protein
VTIDQQVMGSITRKNGTGAIGCAIAGHYHAQHVSPSLPNRQNRLDALGCVDGNLCLLLDTQLQSSRRMGDWDTWFSSRG